MSTKADLERLAAEVVWLREGIEQALRDLQDGRRAVAVSQLKGTLAGEAECWPRGGEG